MPVERDPVASLHATYGITWETAQPYWSGEPISVDFPYSPPQPFYSAWPPVVNSAQSLGSASVTNPGDVAAAAVWRARGPFTGFTVGVGPAVVSMQVTKLVGQWVELDARPGQLTMLDETGARMWSYATSENLTGMAIEPGETVDLTTALDGVGDGAGVSVTFVPRYLWGY
jgi:hypothetical protein